jgi:2-methylisocitrate lyase-like PEP mutase family enzyme
MTRDALVGLAEHLRALHVPGQPVVLPNAWDVTSARTFEKSGFAAIATSSSAMAHSLGYDDGEQTPADVMFAAVTRITGRVGVPVTADIERGYGLEPEQIVERLLESGAVGCNLEDSDPGSGEMVDVETQAGWIGRVVAAAERAGVPVALNARIDVHLREWGKPEERMDEAVRRARAYIGAGATSVYPIGLSTLGEIEELTRRVDGAVNVVFRPNGPSIADLARAGVARISFGGGLHIAMRAGLKRMAMRIRDGQDPYEGL